MEDKANAEVLGGGEVTFSDDGSEAYLCIIQTIRLKILQRDLKMQA